MAGEAEIAEPSWPVEEIPPEARLFMRVEKTYVKNGDFLPGAFRNRPTDKDGMSTDWEKYATPDDTRNRAKVPANNGVIQMQAGLVAAVPGQVVSHTPNPQLNNRSHTDVFGVKDTESRLKLKRLASWVPGLELVPA